MLSVPLSDRESMETSSESTEPMGSSISRMYSSLDVPSRRKYIFSDKMPRKISLDEQEDSPSRKFSQDEMDESLMVNTSRKVSREELDINTLSRKTSVEELEASMDTPRQLTRGETEAGFDSRKLPRDLPLDSTMRYYSTEKMSPAAIGMDSQRQRSLRDRKDHMDSISRVIPKSELDLDTTSGTRYSDALTNTSIKHKENLDFPPNIQQGRIIRENSFDATFDSSVESSKKSKMLGKTDLSKDILSRIMPQDEYDVTTDFERLHIRDIAMDTASRNMIREEFERSRSIRMGIPSKKLSRDEQEFVMDTQRIQRKLDGPVETPIGKIQRETAGLSVESPRRKISQEEFVVTNPGQFGPPDLTASSLMLWKPASDSLNTLVYDGILEMSYENPLEASSCDLSHATSMSSSSQSLLGNEGQLANSSSLESGRKDKGKKSSKLKNLFKKKKDKDKDS